MALTKITGEGVGAVDSLGDAITIDSSNNVGIGTGSPSVVLDTRLGTTTGKVAEFHNSVGYGIGFTVESDGGVNTINSEGNQALAFATNGASNERMRIDASGQIMMHKSSLGVTTAGHEFRNTGVAIHSVNNNTCMELVRFGGTGRLQEFYSTSTLVGNISTNGSSTSYNTSSDYRLKENVVADWDATTRLKQLNPVRFNFIADPDTVVDGFLAHEAQAVVPESVTGTHDEVDADGNPVYQGIDQSKLVPLLVKTIQELEARITALENV